VVGRPYAAAVVDVPRERFEELVADALDEIPDDLFEMMDNVVVVVREGSEGSSLLGLYDGVPLTERGAGYDGMVVPDRISIFRRPILAMCDDEAAVVEQVRITVIHEVAHHFGIDDARLEALGWD
jgi:predicted Zn-dependent protease with MMP-like domain